MTDLEFFVLDHLRKRYSPNEFISLGKVGLLIPETMNKESLLELLKHLEEDGCISFGITLK